MNLSLSLSLSSAGVASNFSPAQVANLGLWLDSAAGVSESAGNLTAWADQSGNSRVTSMQGTPTYSAADANWGGGPSVGLGGAAAIGAVMPIGGTTCAVYMVLRRTVAYAADKGLFSFVDPTQNGNDYAHAANFTIRATTGDVIRPYRNGELGSVAHPGTNVNFAVSARWNGSTETTKANGATSSAAASTGTFGSSGSALCRIGCRYTAANADFYTCSLREVLVYSVNTSDDEDAAIRAYLAAKHGITF